MQGPIHRAVWLPLLWRSVQVWKAGKDRAGEDKKTFKSIWISWLSTYQGTFGEVFKARDRKNKHKVMGSPPHWISFSSTLIGLDYDSQPGGGSQEGVDGKWKGGLPHHSTQVLLWSATINARDDIYWLWQNFENSHYHYREIRILQLLRHENIVNLIEICRTKVFYWEGNWYS